LASRSLTSCSSFFYETQESTTCQHRSFCAGRCVERTLSSSFLASDSLALANFKASYRRSFDLGQPMCRDILGHPATNLLSEVDGLLGLLSVPARSAWSSVKDYLVFEGNATHLKLSPPEEAALSAYPRADMAGCEIVAGVSETRSSTVGVAGGDLRRLGRIGPEFGRRFGGRTLWVSVDCLC
jgi:hypothetical protein